MHRSDPSPIMEVLFALLGPEGCPWDRQQTPHSLCEYVVEETFELVEAVRSKSPADIGEELGDVFFLLFFLSRLLEQEHALDLNRVWRDTADKMKRRHPHVFGDAQVESSQDVWRNWEEIKEQEKEAKGVTDKHQESLASIPDALPPLMKAYRVHAKAAQAGFTWDANPEQAEALRKEWAEWEEAKAGNDQARMEEEFGDLLFSLVEHGRRHGIKANAALHGANSKFLNRFRAMLELARQRGLDWQELDMQDKDRLWEEVKRGHK